MRFRILLFFVSLCSLSSAQYVTIGQGSYGGTNVYGPLYSTTAFDTAYSMQAYIYPSSVLTGLIHGDTISSLEFYAEAEQKMSGNPELKIYLKMASVDTFPAANLNWKNEAASTGVVLVYSGDPTGLLDGTSGFKNFIFNINKFVFDTTKGKSLEMLFAYQQTTRQAANTFWLYENNFTVTAFKSRNEGKINYGKGFAPDTTRFSDVRKPTVRINFPRYQNNIRILKTYCLGKVPLLAGVKDSIKVLVANGGKQTINNGRIYLDISGANQHTDSLDIGKIAPWQEKILSFAHFKPDSSGTDQIITRLSKDDFNDDNQDTLNRLINYNVYSHCDPFLGNTGGIGFSGSTGDFVAKFYTDTGIYINQVSVDFSMSGRGFRLGIWDDDATGGFPGTVLFMSDSLTSKAGTYILPIQPRVKISGGFYVGIRQNTTSNVAFSFQEEDPVRPGAFYFTAPMGNTSWTPFSPGFPYKFNIQPRIQVSDDVAPLDIVYPAANQDIEYSLYDSIGPRATVTNYGFNDQLTPFEVECRIANIYDVTEYLSIKKIDLRAGQTKTVYFDTAFRLFNLGDHRISVTTRLANDKISDNNTIRHTFKVSVKHDLGADIMFSPADLSVFEYKKDTITPTVRINNYGTAAKNNFSVIFRIRGDSGIIYSQSQTRSLAAQKQEIITFPKYVPITIGDYIAECFTVYKDSIPFNDTVRSSITFIKSNDVGPKSVEVPLPQNVYTMGGFFFAKVTLKNYGSKTQASPFLTHMYVYDPDGTQVHYDTVSTPLGGFSETQITYKRFNIPNQFGTYKIVFITTLTGDQEPLNDTLKGTFTVIPNRDITPLFLVTPQPDTVISVSDLPLKPVVRIKNLGSQTLSNAGPVIVQFFRNKQLVYTDSGFFSSNLSYNSQTVIPMKGSFSTTILGDYTCVVYTRLTGDLVRNNDTILSRFRLTRYYDLALDTSSNFSNGQQFTYNNSWFRPQILLINKGSRSYSEVVKVVANLYKNGIWHSSRTTVFDSVPRSASLSWFQDSLISLRQTGNFTVCANIIAGLDENNQNDSFCKSFFIVKPLDLSADSIVFPDRYNYCYQDKVYRPRVKVSNHGTVAAVKVPVDLKIFETTNYIWQQTILVDLLPGSSGWFAFDSNLYFTFTGPSRARVICMLTGDLERNNDTLIRNFMIDKTSSVSSVSSDYRVYANPNPSNGLTEVVLPSFLNARIELTNTAGQLLHAMDKKPGNERILIDLRSHGGSGLYYLRILGVNYNKTIKLICY